MESSESFHSAVDVVGFSRIEEPKPQNSRLFLHKEPEAFSLRKPPTTTTPSVGFTCGLIPTGCKKYLTVGEEEHCLGLVQLSVACSVRSGIQDLGLANLRVAG